MGGGTLKRRASHCLPVLALRAKEVLDDGRSRNVRVLFYSMYGSHQIGP